MTFSFWSGPAAALAVALSMATPLLAQGNNKINNANSQFITLLKAQFTKADLDKDTFLDKDELAKAFHGPKAKAPTQGMYDDQGHLTKTYYEAPKKYPELVLLWAADRDGDDRLNWPEYRDYEVKLQNDRKQQLLAMQRSLQSTRRRTSTRSRRSSYSRRYYSRSSSSRGRYYHHHSYSHYGSRGSSVNYLQRAMINQQRQMIQAAQNWQRMQMQAVMAYRRAYQQAIMMRMQMQQRMVANYYARMRQAAAHRMVQRHVNFAPRRRR